MFDYMIWNDPVSRRSFLALSGAAPLAFGASQGGGVPVGLELYSVRDELTKDLMGTVRAVAQMGYPVVEFYSPYYEWTADYAKQVRKLMDDLGVRCLSTHNSRNALSAESLPKAIELNQIIGSKYIVMASPGRISDIDGYKTVAEELTRAEEKLSSVGLHAGYHNHGAEFTELAGTMPMEVLAANTPAGVMLQLDVGTCVEAGKDPVAWIRKNPGRIQCVHCKDWGKQGGYRVLFGEGDAPWKEIFAAAESAGGVEFYLIEQEESTLPQLEAAERCLANWKKMRA